jgi:hypothetical protein
MTSNTSNQPITYSVVVRDPNCWDRESGIHPLIDYCGHKHKSLDTARACYYRLRNWRNGNTSARWYKAVIEDEFGRQYYSFGDTEPVTTCQELYG